MSLAVASDKMTRKASKRNDTAVKLDAEAARIAKNVATYHGKSLAEYLSEIVLERAATDWQEILDLEQRALPKQIKGKASK